LQLVQRKGRGEPQRRHREPQRIYQERIRPERQKRDREKNSVAVCGQSSCFNKDWRFPNVTSFWRKENLCGPLWPISLF